MRILPRKLQKSLLFAIAAATLCATFAAYGFPYQKERPGRLLYGKVLDRGDNPVVDAVVYLTNMRTHAVKSYIAGQDGTYRFPGLSNADYEVYAQHSGHKSDTKSVSQFDDRSQIYIDLKIDVP